MNNKICGLYQIITWIVTDLTNDKKFIGCKWIYKIKYKYNGCIERHKARLVSKNFNQIKYMDFWDTYSPIAKLTTITLLIAIASFKD